MISRRLILGAAAGAALGAGFARADDDGAVASVRKFYGVLLEAMKNGPRLGFAGRRQVLAPACSRFFDFALMTRLTVGPQWANLTSEQQQQITEAFRSFSIATYANRFDDYSGEQFEVDPEPLPATNGDVVVKSRLVQTSSEPVALDYLMHNNSDGWQAVDVYLSGTVSQLATQRSEFASVLRRGGPDALVERLKTKTAELSG